MPQTAHQIHALEKDGERYTLALQKQPYGGIDAALYDSEGTRASTQFWGITCKSILEQGDSFADVLALFRGKGFAIIPQ